MACQTTGYIPDSKVHGANIGPIWGREDPGGPHVGPMNFAIWVVQQLVQANKNEDIESPFYWAFMGKTVMKD